MCYASFDTKWPHRSRFSVSCASMFLCSNYGIQFKQQKPKVSKCVLVSSSSLNVYSFSFSWGLRLPLRTVRFVVVGLLSCKHFFPEKIDPREREREREGGGKNRQTWGRLLEWHNITTLRRFVVFQNNRAAVNCNRTVFVWCLQYCHFPPSDESGRRVRWSLYPRYNLTTVETMPKPVRISRSHTEDLFLSMLQSLRIACPALLSAHWSMVYNWLFFYFSSCSYWTWNQSSHFDTITTTTDQFYLLDEVQQSCEILFGELFSQWRLCFSVNYCCVLKFHPV